MSYLMQQQQTEAVRIAAFVRTVQKMAAAYPDLEGWS